MKYPKADAKAQWFGDRYAGGEIDGNVVVMHSTEGMGWPAYQGGAVAPQLTYHPGVRGWRQHFPLNRSARALIDANGGVATNRGNAIQVELVGTCDPAFYAKWKKNYPDLVLWSDPPDWALDDIAAFIRWCDAEMPKFNPQQRVPRGWVSYPDSYGLHAKQRLTNAEWDSFYGVLGHQHVPENDHGDPGAFPIERLLAKVAGTPTKEEEFTVNKDDEKKIRSIMREEIDRRLGDVVDAPDFAPDKATNPKWYPASVQRSALWRTEDVRQRLIALSKMIEAIASQTGMTPEQISAAAAAGTNAALDARILDTDVTVTVTPQEG